MLMVAEIVIGDHFSTGPAYVLRAKYWVVSWAHTTTLNVMVKYSSKKKAALDLYASVIAREQTKYDKAHKKKASAKRKVLLSDSEEDSSDSDESFHFIKKKKSSSKKTKVQFVSETEKKDKKKQKPSNEPTAEEKACIKQIAHLEETDESSDKSVSSSDTP
jgi:hypothetical protein